MVMMTSIDFIPGNVTLRKNTWLHLQPMFQPKEMRRQICNAQPVALKHTLPLPAFAKNATLNRFQQILKEFNVQALITNNVLRLSSFILIKKKSLFWLNTNLEDKNGKQKLARGTQHRASVPYVARHINLYVVVYAKNLYSW